VHSEEMNNITNMINYICKFVDSLTVSERQEIYKIIIENNIPDDKIIEKGAGIELKFKHMNHNTIRQIYSLMEDKINKKYKELESFPDKNTAS
jgi:hypothetical protein